jgi:hypothetical protein
MMPPYMEEFLRNFVRKMSNHLAGQPMNLGPTTTNTPIKPSQVRGLEAKLTAAGRLPFAGQKREMINFFRGASTIENYAKAAKGFALQNRLLETFCRLLTQKTGDSCGIIMGPSKKETSTLKKYWAGGREACGWQGDFKDLCRCTIVCYNKAAYGDLLPKMRAELLNACYCGKWAIVDPNVRERNGSDKDLGYTDTNISLQLPNSARAEVQLNVQSTLHGKMGRPAFVEEACPPGFGQAQYASMEQKAELPGGCGHVLYEVFKDFGKNKKCNMTKDQVRQLSRDYYDHLFGRPITAKPKGIVDRLIELSKSEIWRATYDHTQAENPRNLPAFRPGTKWKIGDRV